MSSQFPISAFNFEVLMLGDKISCSEVSGLKVTTEFKEVKSGGQNNMLYKIPMRTSCGEVTLKRGVFNSDSSNEPSSNSFLDKIRKHSNFESSVIGAVGGYGLTKMDDIFVDLLNDDKSFAISWVLLNPVIVSYELSSLNGTANEIAFETLVVAPAGILII